MREHARDRAAPVKADEVTRVGLALTGDGIGARQCRNGLRTPHQN
jgi:hypothetical protein